MRGIALFVLSVVIAILSGCDLFQTREPHPPTQGSSNYVTPTTYDKVLQNLIFAISDKNLNNYLNCFVDTTFRPYVFYAADDARRSYPDVMNQWNLDAEQRYFRNLKEATAGVPSLAISQNNPTFVSSDSVLYEIDYTLFFPHNRSGIPRIVRGNMHLSMITDGKRWAIYQWRDAKTTPDSTWSYLKAAFSGG